MRGNGPTVTLVLPRELCDEVLRYWSEVKRRQGGLYPPRKSHTHAVVLMLKDWLTEQCTRTKPPAALGVPGGEDPFGEE